MASPPISPNSGQPNLSDKIPAEVRLTVKLIWDALQNFNQAFAALKEQIDAIVPASSSATNQSSVTPGFVPFSQIIDGKNTVADMQVGTGASLEPVDNGVVNCNEIQSIAIDATPPAHEGQMLISQPGNTSAAWADPLVQGVYDPGTDCATGGLSGGPIKPVLVGGKGDTDGLLHDLSVDSSGNLNVNSILSNSTVTGSFSNPGEELELTLPGGTSSVALQISGVWTGQLEFEATVDGTNWVPHDMLQSVTDQIANATTGNGAWEGSFGGFAAFRIRASALGSGTADATIVASPGAHAVELDSPLPAGSNLIGKVELSAGSAQIGHLEANQSVNEAQVGGAAIDTNSGVKSPGTQRVVIATDQPAFTTPVPISAASLPLPTGASTEVTLSSILTKSTWTGKSVTGSGAGNVGVTLTCPANKQWRVKAINVRDNTSAVVGNRNISVQILGDGDTRVYAPLTVAASDSKTWMFAPSVPTAAAFTNNHCTVGYPEVTIPAGSTVKIESFIVGVAGDAGDTLIVDMNVEEWF